MNDRIKDILAQPVFERLNDWVNIGPVQKATLEEFAELIMRECIETLRLVPYTSDRAFGDEEIYQEAIKDHFKV